jgi:hypothetical protein
LTGLKTAIRAIALRQVLTGLKTAIRAIALRQVLTGLKTAIRAIALRQVLTGLKAAIRAIANKNDGKIVKIRVNLTGECGTIEESTRLLEMAIYAYQYLQRRQRQSREK